MPAQRPRQAHPTQRRRTGKAAAPGDTKQAGNHGGTGYPLLPLLAVVGCGTRTVIDAVFASMSSGETSYARHLLKSLRSGMTLLANRNFAAGWL